MTSRITAPVDTVEETSRDDYRDEICNVSTMSRSPSPQFENVIRSFNAELDNFTKSFDEMASSIKKSSTPSYSRQPLYHFSTDKKSAPSRIRDPPPSADRHTPLRNYSQSTPARNRVSSTPSYSPAEPPPAPVETPAFFTSPMATPNPKRRQNSSSRKSDPRPLDLELDAAPNDWENALNKMRQTLQDQENRIQELEQENDSLRAQIQNQSGYYHEEQAPPEMLYREDSVIPERSPWGPRRRGEDPDGGARYSVAESRRREEPKGRRSTSTPSEHHATPISTPMRTIRSPPSRIRTTNSHMMSEKGFTPGTRFVAELSKLMHMGKDHHVPLSFILDKHWDQLKAHFNEDDQYR